MKRCEVDPVKRFFVVPLMAVWMVVMVAPAWADYRVESLDNDYQGEIEAAAEEGKYLVLFPFVAFAWFIVLTVLLTFLAKNRAVDDILLVSMAVLSAIRVTAYYNEDLSRDLAKILPFALLGVFLIDLSYFSIPASVDALQRTMANAESVVYYLVFVIGLEFLLRISSPILDAFLSPSKHRKSPAVSSPAVSPAGEDD